jgi:hypothetical protein
LQEVFESSELVEIVGIPLILLNKLIERGQYGIQANVRAGDGRGSRRLFSDRDLFGIALIWWLYEAGLRTKVIQFVLNQICGGKLRSRASDAAGFLNKGKHEFLLVDRASRTEVKKGATHPLQRVVLADREQTIGQIKQLGTRTMLALPIRELYSRLKDELDQRQVNSAKRG